jgi:hypothetical protein
MFVPAKKGGQQVGLTKRGKGTEIMGLADRHGLPRALWTTGATPAEVSLAEPTLVACFVTAVPERLIGDKAYDSDALDQKLLQSYGWNSLHQTKSPGECAHKLADCCAVTGTAGKSNGSLYDFLTFAGWWCVTNTMPQIFKALFIWLLVLSSRSIYEMRSRFRTIHNGINNYAC